MAKASGDISKRQIIAIKNSWFLCYLYTCTAQYQDNGYNFSCSINVYMCNKTCLKIQQIKKPLNDNDYLKNNCKIESYVKQSTTYFHCNASWLILFRERNVGHYEEHITPITELRTR